MTGDKLFVDFDKNTEGTLHIDIYDNLGRIVLVRNNVGNVVDINKGLLASGLYVVKITNKKGLFVIKKLYKL